MLTNTMHLRVVAVYTRMGSYHIMTREITHSVIEFCIEMSHKV